MMETGLIFCFGVLIAFCVIVACEEVFYAKQDLDDYWDFTSITKK
jgi:hypothetical protein